MFCRSISNPRVESSGDSIFMQVVKESVRGNHYNIPWVERHLLELGLAGARHRGVAGERGT